MKALEFRCLLVALLAASLNAIGCSVLGPTTIRTSRAAYNEAIVATNNEQVLGMIVRMRYGEPSGMLTVSSVTANLNIQGTIGSEYGIGSDSSFEGNLVPLSAGIAYEENPTISYVPLQGEKYLRQLVSPLPVDLTVPVLNAVGTSPLLIGLLFRSINGARNPDDLVGGSSDGSRFARIVDLLTELDRDGSLTWMESAPGSFAVTLYGAGTAYEQQVGELYEVLGFSAPKDLDGVAELPVQMGIGKPAEPAIQVTTRSLYQLLNRAASAVEVPEEHLQSGLAPGLPRGPAIEPAIRIRGSDKYPWDAMIAVKHHGWWYSIDETDARSKLTFRVLESIMSARLAEASDKGAAPVLTVPASR